MDKFRLCYLKNGVFFKEARFPTDTAPRVDYHRDSVIKSSIAAEIYPDDDVDYLKDEIQPQINIGGQWESLGVYRFVTISKSGNEFETRCNITGYDRNYILKERLIENTFFLPAGTNYVAAVENLLSAAGLTMPIKTPSDKVLPADKEWSAGKSLLTIINELLAEINYEDLYFDAAGFAHIKPYTAPSADNIAWYYDSESVRNSNMTANYTDSSDYWSAPNVFVCTCASADREAILTSTAVNDNPLSSRSTQSRGMRITVLINVPDIADQTALDLYAYRKMVESQMSERVVTFETMPEAGHGQSDTIAIVHSDIGGVYEETGWSIEMTAGGLMKHTARGAIL